MRIMQESYMKFNITWNYPIISRQHDETVVQIKDVSQTIKIKIANPKNSVEMPSFCMGMYITNLYNACKVDLDCENYLSSQAFKQWRKIVGEPYFAINKWEVNYKQILFDSMTYPAFCIFKNVRTMLAEICHQVHDGESVNSSACTRKILGNELLSRITRDNLVEQVETIQKCIDNYVKDYNELLKLSLNYFDDDIYKKLCECLEKYSDSKLAKQYLAPKEQKGRCFATFIDTNKNKYISFSGFVDAKDKKILRWLGVQVSDFVRVAEEICTSLHAEFVPINLQTRRYCCEDDMHVFARPSTSLNDIIDFDLRELKGYYSCCERKIFGYFEDKTPNGTLYVKMKICGECSLGLAYQRERSEIVLYDGLEC